jgi:hypothetical protein
MQKQPQAYAGTCSFFGLDSRSPTAKTIDKWARQLSAINSLGFASLFAAYAALPYIAYPTHSILTGKLRP